MLDPATAALLARYQTATSQVRARVDRLAVAAWAGLPAWREPDIDALVRVVAPALDAAQLRTATLTDGYLAAVDTTRTGRRPAPLGVKADDVSTMALRGVSTATVLQRVGPTVWTALGAGDTLDDATRKGLRRLRTAVATNLQLAATHTAQRSLDGNDRVGGYRRALQGDNNCALCIVASTQRYRTDQLQPIHPGCQCKPVPIYGDDPGWVIDQDQLDRVHDTLEAEFGSMSESARTFATVEDEAISYRDVIVVNQHGELGPVLGVRGHNFTGPADLAA